MEAYRKQRLDLPMNTFYRSAAHEKILAYTCGLASLVCNACTTPGSDDSGPHLRRITTRVARSHETNLTSDMLRSCYSPCFLCKISSACSLILISNSPSHLPSPSSSLNIFKFSLVRAAKLLNKTAPAPTFSDFHVNDSGYMADLSLNICDLHFAHH
jgi:hypothetical protein